MIWPYRGMVSVTSLSAAIAGFVGLRQAFEVQHGGIFPKKRAWATNLPPMLVLATKRFQLHS